MDLNDVFGQRSGRPTSKDFWKLSELVLQLDGKTEGRKTQAGADLFTTELAKHIDVKAAMYLASQRALRVAGPTAGVQKLTELSVMYLEGMIMGMRFAEGGGHEDG